MTEAQRRRTLQMGSRLGYNGNNMGQLDAIAQGILSGTRNSTAAQRRTATAIRRVTSNSA